MIQPMAEDQFQMQVIWPEVEQLPVFRANQFLGQISSGVDNLPEDIVLTLGYVTPPVALGSEEERRATLAAIGAMSVKPISRISMSLGQAEGLRSLLDTVITNWREIESRQ